MARRLLRRAYRGPGPSRRRTRRVCRARVEGGRVLRRRVPGVEEGAGFPGDMDVVSSS